jgi:Ca2+:H+ antiporter
VLVRTKPERLDGAHPHLTRAADVLVQTVADEQRRPRSSAERVEGAPEDHRVRLPAADLGGEHGEIDARGDARVGEVAVEQVRWVEGVRDEAELQPVASQRLEQGVRRRPQLPSGRPGCVLGFEVAVELVVADLDLEVAEELPDEPRVLDLLERAGQPEQRLVRLAESLSDLDVVAADRLEACTMTRDEQVLVPRPLHQGVAPVEQHGLDHGVSNVVDVARRILLASLALSPLTILLHYVAHIGGTAEFVLAALSLIPLAWLIGEATEHAAHHTGAGIGGFLNATFGNAPELIIALFAVSEGLEEVVRGSLTGSVVGNLLLVLGFSLLFGGRGELDRASSFVSVGLVALAVLLFLIPALPGWDGNPERDSLVRLSLIPAVVLLLIYVGSTWYSLRRFRLMHIAAEPEEMRAWSLRLSLLVLGVATVVTALVAEILVGSLDSFAEKANLSDFFVAAVIVAIVGNAAEHGGAVVVAARGKIRLAAEIALASSAQVAVFLVPAVALLSWLIDPLALSFREVEIVVLAVAAIVTAALLVDGHSSRLKGVVLILAYVGAAAAFFVAGDR